MRVFSHKEGRYVPLHIINHFLPLPWVEAIRKACPALHYSRLLPVCLLLHFFSSWSYHKERLKGKQWWNTATAHSYSMWLKKKDGDKNTSREYRISKYKQNSLLTKFKDLSLPPPHSPRSHRVVSHCKESEIVLRSGTYARQTNH